MAEPLTPQQIAEQRQHAAAEYAAQFDVSDQPEPPIPDDEPPTRPLPPRAPDGTFKKAHPAALKNLALDLGIPEEDIEGLETADLDRVVKVTARQALRIQREASDRQKTILNSVDRNITQQVQEPAPPEADPFADMGEFDPRLVNMLRSQDKTIKELREQLTGVNQREVQRVARTSGEMLDDAFAALGASFEPFFGKGNAVDGEVEAESLNRRRALVGLAGIDFSKPFTVKSVTAAIKKAAESMYGPALANAQPPAQVDPYAQPATPTPPVTARQKQWQENTVAKPTQRQSVPEPPGRAKAIRSVSRILESERAAVNNENNGSAEPEDFLEG